MQQENKKKSLKNKLKQWNKPAISQLSIQHTNSGKPHTSETGNGHSNSTTPS